MWSIQLQSTTLNQWLDEAEEKLTRAEDAFDVMETEVNQINKVWESGAGEIWKGEFQVRVRETRAVIGETKKVVSKFGSLGAVLADVESKAIAGAEKL